MKPHPLDEDARARGRTQAVAARRQRAQIKKDVATGELSLASVLSQRTDHVIGRLRIGEIIACLPGFGPAKTDAILNEVGVEPQRRLGQLGEHQTARILQILAPRMKPWKPVARARLLVLSGPSGVGKSSIVGYIREHHPDIWFSVSVTTRPPRPGEVDGVDYFFITAERFEELQSQGALLEWASFAGNFYGTPAEPVRERLNRGIAVMCEIELAGARQVRAADPHALLVFLAPPSWDVLVERLTGRGTESPEVVSTRLITAREELAAEAEFDVVVVNDHIARAAEEIIALLVQ
jgi:guanylate kinase